MANLAVPLTYSQEVAIRFHLGYPNRMSDDSTVAPYYRLAELEALDFKLTHLSPNEQPLVVSQLNLILTAYKNWQTQQNSLLALTVTNVVNNLEVVAAARAFYIQLCLDLASLIGVDYRGAGMNASRVVV